MSNFLSGTRMHSAVLTVALTAGDHSQMQGMDHSQMQGMDHSKMEGMQPAKQPQTQSRTPIPPLTDADRAAVYNAPGGHEVHDSALNSFFIFEKLEWQDADDGSALNWEAQGWIGGDVDRLWLRTEGERTNGKTEEAEVHALWGHAISPWWDLVGGVRQDFKPGDPQTWAAFGIQGLALYNFEAKATAYLGEGGQTSALGQISIGRVGQFSISTNNRRQNSISMAKTIPNVEWVQGCLKVRLVCGSGTKSVRSSHLTSV